VARGLEARLHDVRHRPRAKAHGCRGLELSPSLVREFAVASGLQLKSAVASLQQNELHVCIWLPANGLLSADNQFRYSNTKKQATLGDS
jgi:hypothetical protein